MDRWARSAFGAIIALTLTTLGTSCASSGEPGLSAAPTVEGGTPPAPQDDPSRSDLTDETSIPWTKVDTVSPTELRVHFTAGSTKCFGTRTDVTETAEKVTITVFEGAIPDAPTTCAAVGRIATALVQLQDPVGDRQVAHGVTVAPSTDASPQP